MYGSRSILIEPGERAADDLTLPAGIFTWGPDSWDNAATSSLDFEAQDSGGTGESGYLALRVASTNQVVRQWIIGLPADTDWHRYSFDISGIGLTNGVDYRVEWSGDTALKIRNLTLRHAVSTPGAPQVANPFVGQAVGDGRTLSLWPLFPVKAYLDGEEGEARYPSQLPTKDKSWATLCGAPGTANATTWAEVPDSGLWSYRPNDWGGAVSFTLEVVAAGDYGGSTFSRWLVALFYADSNELIPGSIIDIEGNAAALFKSAEFHLRGNEEVVAKVVRIGANTADLSIQAVRLAITSVGGADTPMLKTCGIDTLLGDAGSVTGSTWGEVLALMRTRLAGSVDHQSFLEATMARTGSAGDAELQLLNVATGTTLATLTTTGAAALVRSLDLRAAMSMDGLLLDSPEAALSWQAGLELRGDAAGVVGECRMAHLVHVTRHDPVSCEATVVAGWLLALDDSDLDLTAAWVTISGLDLDLTADWSVLAGKNLNVAAAWALGRTPDVDMAAAWEITLPEADLDMAAAWSVQHAIDANLPASWLVAAPVDFDVTSAWKVKFSSDADLAAAWALLFQVDLPATWAIAQPDKDLDIAAAWVTFRGADVDMATQWAVKAQADLNIKAQWSINTGLDLDMASQWVLYRQTDADMASAWAVTGTRNLSMPAGWLVAAPKDLNAPAAWLLRFSDDADLAAAWVVRFSTDLDLAAAWSVGQIPLYTELAAAWAVKFSADADLSAAWNLGAILDLDMAAAWEIRGALTVSMAAAWLIHLEKDADMAASWAIVEAKDADMAAGWTVVPADVLREKITSTIQTEVALTSTIVEVVTLQSIISDPTPPPVVVTNNYIFSDGSNWIWSDGNNAKPS